jgi:hypothetical protein
MDQWTSIHFNLIRPANTLKNEIKILLSSFSGTLHGLAGRYRHTRAFSLRALLAARELTKFTQANSPNDLPAGRTIHMRSAFQIWTVQAERKVKLYVYGGA